MPSPQPNLVPAEPARYGQFLLTGAVHCQYVEDAIREIRNLLDIPESDVASAVMPDQRTWSRMQQRERLITFASWITAECHAEADRGDHCTLMPIPKSVVGTND